MIALDTRRFTLWGDIGREAPSGQKKKDINHLGTARFIVTGCATQMPILGGQIAS